MVVIAAILIRDGKILLALRSSGRHLEGYWEFPGGKLEPGETPESCLAREIREELGIDIEVGARVASSVHPYDAHVVELIAYAARPLSSAYALSAHSEIRWVPPGELLSFNLAPADVPIARRIAEDASLLG